MGSFIGITRLSFVMCYRWRISRFLAEATLALFCCHSGEFVDSDSAMHPFGDPDSSMQMVKA